MTISLVSIVLPVPNQGDHVAEVEDLLSRFFRQPMRFVVQPSMVKKNASEPQTSQADLTTAALGGQIEVPTLEGSASRVKVPEGTESGKQFRLKSKGMPVLRSKAVGDMYIQVDVETPKSLTRRQRELLEEFEKESHKETSPESAGFFARVKDFFEGKTG